MAALFFATAIGLMLWRIWFRRFSALRDIPTDIDTKQFVRHDEKLGKAFAVFAAFGLLSAVLGTLGEVRCYEKPAGPRCDDVMPPGARNL